MLPRDFAINKSFVDRAKYFSQMLNDKAVKALPRALNTNRGIYITGINSRKYMQ
jgi:hypothetical protein